MANALLTSAYWFQILPGVRMSIFHFCRRLTALLLAALTWCVLIPGVATAGTCRKAVSEAKVEAKITARFRELQCQLDGDPSVKLSVKFQTLGESAASVLLYKGKAPFTEKLYGKTKVLENAVLKEYRTLLDKFGNAQRYEGNDSEAGGVGLVIQGADQPESDDPGGATPKGVVQAYSLITYAEGPFHEALLHILNEPTFPPSYNLSYGTWDPEAAKGTLGASVSIWRYATRDDFLALPQNLKRYNELIAPRDRANRKELDTNSTASAALFAHLMRNGAPQSFLRFSSHVGEGCEMMGFGLNNPSLEVDVAFVRNASSLPVALDGFVGAENTAVTVRPDNEGAGNGSDALGAQAVELAPGETLVVPLRLRFKHVDADEPDMDAETKAAVAENLAEAKKSYERIQATKPGTKFKMLVGTDIKNNRPRGAERDTYWIVKTREAFTPHTEPEIRNHIYGPEWHLGAVKVGGETVPLVDAEIDVVDFTADSGVGSCPVLYVWSESDQHWERRGKVIHKAQGKANAQSETVRFAGWQPRFKIVEEELEVAHLDAISAVIALDDGTTLALSPPRSEAGGAPLTFPASYYYAEGTEVVFTLPDGVTPERVTETRLTVSGYYERYSSLLVERFARDRRTQSSGVPLAD